LVWVWNLVSLGLDLGLVLGSFGSLGMNSNPDPKPTKTQKPENIYYLNFIFFKTKKIKIFDH